MIEAQEKPSVADYAAGFNAFGDALRQMSGETKQLNRNLHQFFDAYQARPAIDLAAERAIRLPR